ncbi:acetyltransferase (GNAT) family protein [Peptococcaceae bacterium CEB3]|nr:acetyltransferase (GNAT) family protein [Peptococcaceae bacterium CEB3]
MSFTVRIAEPHDLDQIARLSDRVFRSKRTTHMAEEFPHLYSPHNARHWFVAEDGGQIRSIIGAMVWPAVIAGARTRVASVGSVATDPDYRGQGLASRLLYLAQSQLAAEAVRLMLISGDLPLYLKFGARSIGRVDWYALPRNLAVAGRYSIRPIDPQDDAAIVARLYQTRSTRFGRTLAQLRAMLVAQPITQVERGVKVALLVLSDGVPVSYLILNHRPFQGVGASRLSEWAGDPKGVLHALTQVSDWPEQGIRIPVLREDLAMQGTLYPLKPDRRGPVSWLVKVIDGVGLASDLAPIGTEQAAQPPRVLLTAPDTYAVEFNGQRWVVNAAELTEWVFSEETAYRPVPLEAIWPLPSLWPEGLNYI